MSVHVCACGCDGVGVCVVYTRKRMHERACVHVCVSHLAHSIQKCIAVLHVCLAALTVPWTSLVAGLSTRTLQGYTWTHRLISWK